MTASREDQERISVWNATSAPYSRHATICDLVTQAAERWRDRPAVVDDAGVAYRHDTLAARSNQIANLLVSLQQRSGSFVGFLGGHCPESIACLLGILKTGAAYVPLDPRWPFERLVSVLAPLGIECLVHTRDQLKRASELAWALPTVKAIVCPEIEEEIPAAEQADERGIRELWNDIASSADPIRASGFNLRAAATYTAGGVDAYRDHVVSLVRASAGDRARVLDIGCGAGLILRALAGTASRYVGTDPASSAIAVNREWAAATGTRVELIEAFAHELAERVSGPFDVVLVSSVVQFFPGPAYLAAVVRYAATLLAPSGVLIVADVVDPASGQLPDGMRLPRHYFADLAAASGLFSSAVVHDRGAVVLPDELAERYDVVMTKGPAERGPSKRWWTGYHVSAAPATPPPIGPTADDIAYLIFTSGSTGEPKGVMVQHHGAVNVIEWVNKTYSVGPEDRILFATSFAFDLSVYDIFGILAAGASIRVVPDRELGEPESLVALIGSEPITFWDSAPAAFIALMPFARLRSAVHRDRRVLVFLGGDWVPLSLPDEIRRWLPSAQLVVLGGATEATIWSNYFTVETVNPSWPSIPYGYPIQNARYYVLDEALEMCMIGEPGDLYIGSDCLSLGYFGDGALTASKFLPDPYAPTSGCRMYATGDRARWLANGTVEFLGRVDNQVKVRGYRIELGEVEAALRKYPGVFDSTAVVVGSGASRRLAGFVMTRTPPNQEALMRFLRARIPEPMVPSTIHAMDAFPLGSTGKIDRDALRQLAERAWTSDASSPSAAVGALDDAPLVVRQLWQTALMRGEIREGDDFFALGGHSLLAAQLVAEIRERFGIAFGVRELFQRPRFADVLEVIESRIADGRRQPRART